MYFFCYQSHSEVDVRVDCRASKNCLSNRGDLDYIIKIESHSTEVRCKVQNVLKFKMSLICRGNIPVSQKNLHRRITPGNLTPRKRNNYLREHPLEADSLSKQKLHYERQQ